MSADNFHHQVENQLKKAQKVYDFSDFIDCVQLANSGKVNVKPMEISDFYKYKDHSSQYKLKKCEKRTYLKDIVCIEVQRNSMKLFAKTTYDDNNMIEIDFLKTKLVKESTIIPEPERNQKARGITQERKTGILRKLSNIIPHNRLLFWENLPVNEESVDLTENREPQE
ncbi:unnamed protein product [Euphydryas editha]|nr:unnamed protein product [Euphydryas editha]